MSNILTQNLWFFIWHFLKSYKIYAFTAAFLSMLTGLWSPFGNASILHLG